MPDRGRLHDHRPRHGRHRQDRARHRQGERDVEILGIKEGKQTTTVTGIEMFRKLLDEGQAGENVGLLLRGIKREEVERGQVVAKPARSPRTPSSRPTSTSCPRTRVAGTRRSTTTTVPQFYFRTTDVTGVVHLPEGTEMVMPATTPRCGSR
jgi:elongation factor Tu